MRLLIDQGADLHARDLGGETAMHGAVIGGHLNAVKWLVAQGLDHNIRGEQGTALELAVTKNKEEPGFAAGIVMYLSGGKVKPLLAPKPGLGGSKEAKLKVVTGTVEETETVDPKVSKFLYALSKYSLMIAAKEGNLKVVEELLLPPEPVDPNDPFLDDGEYGYPLHAAAANGHSLVVALLLERGADVNAQGFQLGTALHFAVFKGHTVIAAILIAWGANINTISQVEEGLSATPLEIAASNGQSACVKYLLSQGADVNLSGGSVVSALHAAAISPNSFEITALLLRSGADIRKLSGKGLSAADIAHARENYRTRDLLRQCGCPMKSFFSPQHHLAFDTLFSLTVERTQAQQQEQRIEHLIEQFAAQLAMASI